MASTNDGSFSLSVSRRGDDIIIGGSGALDLAGIGSLRSAITDACAKEGVSVALDLTLVRDMDQEALAHLVEIVDSCRDAGITLSLSFASELVGTLRAAGYDEGLVPLSG